MILNERKIWKHFRTWTNLHHGINKWLCGVHGSNSTDDFELFSGSTRTRSHKILRLQKFAQGRQAKWVSNWSFLGTLVELPLVRQSKPKSCRTWISKCITLFSWGTREGNFFVKFCKILSFSGSTSKTREFVTLVLQRLKFHLKFPWNFYF